MLLHEGGKHEQSPDAVDDAGNASQQFDGDTDRAAQDHRAAFGEENRDPKPDRYGDDHSNKRRDDRAHDGCERAKFFGNGVPNLGRNEAEAEGAEGRISPDHQRDEYGAQYD